MTKSWLEYMFESHTIEEVERAIELELERAFTDGYKTAEKGYTRGYKDGQKEWWKHQEAEEQKKLRFYGSEVNDAIPINRLYEFTLKLDAEFTAEAAKELAKAGCDDALLIRDLKGVYLNFNREATSLQEAITSALSDVRKAGYKATRYRSKK